MVLNPWLRRIQVSIPRQVSEAGSFHLDFHRDSSCISSLPYCAWVLAAPPEGPGLSLWPARPEGPTSRRLGAFERGRRPSDGRVCRLPRLVGPWQPRPKGPADPRGPEARRADEPKARHFSLSEAEGRVMMLAGSGDSGTESNRERNERRAHQLA